MMKNGMNKFILLIPALILYMSVGLACFAAETAPTEETQGAEEGCLLTFSLTDKTNGNFTDEITITLMNIDTNMEYSYSMSSGDYLFGFAVGGIVEKGTYNIALYYAGKEQFRIRNADGTEITSIDANGESHTFDWVAEDIGRSGIAQGGMAETKAGEHVPLTDSVQADEIFCAFMDSISILETDSRYAAVMKFYETTKDVYARYYATACEGKAEDDYLAMTPMERFLWYETYVTPVMAGTYSDYDTYFGSLDKWNANVVGNAYNLLKNQGAVEQAEEYKTLMEWQYHYFRENGAFYNFMTGKTSLEEDSNLETVPSDESIKEEMESAKTDKGIWSGTAALLKNNVFTMVLLIILAGACGGVILYRKRKAIDDDKEV